MLEAEVLSEKHAVAPGRGDHTADIAAADVQRAVPVVVGALVCSSSGEPVYIRPHADGVAARRRRRSTQCVARANRPAAYACGDSNLGLLLAFTAHDRWLSFTTGMRFRLYSDIIVALWTSHLPHSIGGIVLRLVHSHLPGWRSVPGHLPGHRLDLASCQLLKGFV